MNYFRILLVLGLSLPIIFATSEKEMMELRTSVKGLSFTQRTMLLLASKVNPELFHGLPMETLLIDDYQHEYIDAVFVDLRSLLALARNIQADASLPEIDDFRVLEFCADPFCWHYNVATRTGQSKFVGVQDITSKTEFTPTSFRNTYTIPHMKWTSPGFVMDISTPISDIEGVHYQYRDFHISIDEMKTVFQANYVHDPDLGLQVHNLTIDFSLVSYFHLIDQLVTLYPNGTKEATGPYGGGYEADVVQTWEKHRENYIEALEFKINCILSNGRKDPEGCDLVEQYYDRVKYYKMNIVQLFETFGLASITGTP